MSKIEELAEKVRKANANLNEACARYRAAGETIAAAQREKRAAEDAFFEAEQALLREVRGETEKPR